MTTTLGQPGFFTPHHANPWLSATGARTATSYYDTEPLRQTLLELVDFDMINEKRIRFAVGAVNVLSGNFIYFDNAHDEIIPEHIMASGALPPALPMVKVGTDHFWDGGIVSNTPLQHLLDQEDSLNSLVFQVDLFSARGRMPCNLGEVAERSKDIQFASRTRLNTDLVAAQQKLTRAAQNLAARLPARFANDPDLIALLNAGSPAAVTIVHLIHRSKHYETQSKDYEFSRHTVREHWEAGRADAEMSLKSRSLCTRGRPLAGIRVFDLTPAAET